MTLQSVPTPDGSTPFWSETVALDGTAFILLWNFNQCCQSWYLSLQTIDGEDVVDGLKLVPFWNVLIKCASPLRPPGWLFILTSSPTLLTPNLNDFAPGGVAQLVYAPIADVEAA